MINKLAGILVLSAITFSTLGQTAETRKPTARPDIPGIFTLEIGANRALNGPDNFRLGLWGSRTINIYYQYEMRILKSKFSFVPGIGLSLERYKFRDGSIISHHRLNGNYDNPVLNTDSVLTYALFEHQIPGMKKSQLITNYVELPLELRFTLNPDDPNRSFKIGIGGRIGYLYDGFSKIKFREDSQNKQVKDKQLYNLNRFRYGAFAKIGFGSFSLFGYYNLNTLFKQNEGMYNNGQFFNEMNTFTAGISLSSF